VEQEVSAEIKKLNEKKVAGADGISPKILRLCPDIFAKPLTMIFNKSIEDGVYPTDMKLAKVVAIF
jgi:hypothetical protein